MYCNYQRKSNNKENGEENCMLSVALTANGSMPLRDAKRLFKLANTYRYIH